MTGISILILFLIAVVLGSLPTVPLPRRSPRRGDSPYGEKVPGFNRRRADRCVHGVVKVRCMDCAADFIALAGARRELTEFQRIADALPTPEQVMAELEKRP